MSDTFIKVCSICGVKYDEDADMYKLNTGAVKDRNFVFTRVCQYLSPEKKADCINHQGEYREGDAYKPLL